MHNLTHPTFSLNHNWANAHNLRAIYHSLADEVARCREAIADAREILIDAVRRREGDVGPEGEWRAEWEETVNRLVEQSEGWRCVMLLLLLSAFNRVLHWSLTPFVVSLTAGQRFGE